MSRRKPYRLAPELVPSDLWGRSAYRMLGGRAAWTKKIRPNALAKAGNSCEICSSKGGRLICHDKWRYDDKKATATLIGFEIHCGNCDSVTHFGRMFKVGGVSGEVFLSLFIHLCNVNGCKTRAALDILKEAHDLWEKRDKSKWKIIVVPDLLKLYPELEPLPRFKPLAKVG